MWLLTKFLFAFYSFTILKSNAIASWLSHPSFHDCAIASRPIWRHRRWRELVDCIVHERWLFRRSLSYSILCSRVKCLLTLDNALAAVTGTVVDYRGFLKFKFLNQLRQKERRRWLVALHRAQENEKLFRTRVWPEWTPSIDNDQSIELYVCGVVSEFYSSRFLYRHISCSVAIKNMLFSYSSSVDVEVSHFLRFIVCIFPSPFHRRDKNTTIGCRQRRERPYPV